MFILRIVHSFLSDLALIHNYMLKILGVLYKGAVLFVSIVALAAFDNQFVDQFFNLGTSLALNCTITSTADRFFIPDALVTNQHLAS